MTAIDHQDLDAAAAKEARRARLFTTINKADKWLKVLGLAWVAPVLKAAAGDNPRAQMGEIWRLLGVPLLAIAHGRSGDKGMHSNIGIVARKPEYLPLIREQLTAEAVAEHMVHVFDDPENQNITRFDLPGLYAMNFFLEESLGGGGVVSLRNDNQGECYAQMLLDMPVEVPADWDVTLPPMTA